MQLQEVRKLFIRQQISYTQHHLRSSISSNANDEHKNYHGAAETSFKERYSNYIATRKILNIKSIGSVPNFQNIFEI